MKTKYVRVMAVCTVLGFSGLCAGKPVSADAEIEKEIRILEEQEVRAVLARDAATLGRLWDRAYVVHNPEGRIVPAGGSVRDRPVLQTPRVSFVREVERITVNGDVAFSMGSEIVTSAGPADAEVVVKRRYTNVWMRKDGTWKLAARHANKICGGDSLDSPKRVEHGPVEPGATTTPR